MNTKVEQDLLYQPIVDKANISCAALMVTTLNTEDERLTALEKIKKKYTDDFKTLSRDKSLSPELINNTLGALQALFLDYTAQINRLHLNDTQEEKKQISEPEESHTRVQAFCRTVAAGKKMMAPLLNAGEKSAQHEWEKDIEKTFESILNATLTRYDDSIMSIEKKHLDLVKRMEKVDNNSPLSGPEHEHIKGMITQLIDIQKKTSFESVNESVTWLALRTRRLALSSILSLGVDSNKLTKLHILTKKEKEQIKHLDALIAKVVQSEKSNMNHAAKTQQVAITQCIGEIKNEFNRDIGRQGRSLASLSRDLIEGKKTLTDIAKHIQSRTASLIEKEKLLTTLVKGAVDIAYGLGDFLGQMPRKSVKHSVMFAGRELASIVLSLESLGRYAAYKLNPCEATKDSFEKAFNNFSYQQRKAMAELLGGTVAIGGVLAIALTVLVRT